MRPAPRDVICFIGRSIRRIAVTLAGIVLIVLGIILMPLPGPGSVVVLLGFGVLATEYVWAATVLERTRRTAGQVARLARERVRRNGRGNGHDHRRDAA